MKVRANTLQVLDSLRQLTEISEDFRVEATDILLQEISSSGDNQVALLVRDAPPLLDVVSGSNPALLTSCVHGCGNSSLSLGMGHQVKGSIMDLIVCTQIS
jgi:hypothetical protein